MRIWSMKNCDETMKSLKLKQNVPRTHIKFIKRERGLVHRIHTCFIAYVRLEFARVAVLCGFHETIYTAFGCRLHICRFRRYRETLLVLSAPWIAYRLRLMVLKCITTN